MATTIFGAGDDLIEVEGDIIEEFNVYLDGDEAILIAFSDGTILRATYDKDGIWRLHRAFKGTSKFTKQEGESSEDTMDRVTLSGIHIDWVVLGKQSAIGGH